MAGHGKTEDAQDSTSPGARSPSHSQSRSRSASLDSDDAGDQTHKRSGNASKAAASAVKDRDCPYCHQQFTSSSLGRHLDTFIRERNPKPPDGVHNVIEIRKMRGAITRRHARMSTHSGRAESQGGQYSESATVNGDHQPSTPRLLSATAPVSRTEPPESMDNTPPHPVQPRLHPAPDPLPHPASLVAERSSYTANKAHWTATGVINNLPPRMSVTPSARDLPHPGNAEGHDFKVPGYNNLDSEERRNAHAMELAFKEVLRTVHEAALRVNEQQLFDFDFFALTFPALCLRVLPPPPMLFSTTPKPTTPSWPTSIPSHVELELLRHAVGQRSQERERRRKYSYTANDIENIQRYYVHIDTVYEQWNQIGEMQQWETWKLELMRSLSEESTKRKELEKQLMHARDDLEQLRSQYRSPHSAIYSAPSLPNPSERLANELLDGGQLAEWDFDRLVIKWKQTLPHASSAAYATSNTPSSGTAGPSPKEYQTAPPAYARPTTSQPFESYSPRHHASGVEDGPRRYSAAFPGPNGMNVPGKTNNAVAADGDVQMRDEVLPPPPLSKTWASHKYARDAG